MSWLLIVLIGHLLNAIAFLMDKFLLTKRIGSPFVYAFFIGALGVLGVALAPFGFKMASYAEIARALASGASFVLALIFFFYALKKNEASRVVPLTGGLVPAFTFILAYVFLGERLGASAITAFFLLVAGGVLITLDRRGRGSASGYFYAIIAAFIFAVSFVITKQVYLEQNFVSGFVWSRIGGFLAALMILLLPRERHAVFHQPKQKGSGKTTTLFFTGQAAGALGFVLVNYAISLASVSLVNAMQGVQYAFLLITVAILSRRFPKILSEQLSGSVLAQKLVAIALISAGIGLIAF